MGMKRFTIITELSDYRKMYWIFFFLYKNKLPLTVNWESCFLTKYDICIYTGLENKV